MSSINVDSEVSSVVTIDGPSASGKSSVSRELAKKLGWNWVSTGAFYRGLAWVAIKEKVESSDVPKLVKLCSDPIWSVEMRPDKTAVIWRGTDVTDEVFSEAVGEKASHISKLQEVRKALLEAQRNCAKNGKGLVAEGRDCGTVVFPKAILKVFLTASQEARALRRAREQGLDVDKIQASQTERDQQDSTRTAAPLQVPPDALVLDTDHLNLAEAVEKIHEWTKLALQPAPNQP
jgi:cytidylate kinase